jgi:hypothetical protein
MANLKFLIFVKKSWLNKLKIDCKSSSNLVELIREDLESEELEQFEDSLE